MIKYSEIFSGIDYVKIQRTKILKIKNKKQKINKKYTKANVQKIKFFKKNTKEKKPKKKLNKSQKYQSKKFTKEFLLNLKKTLQKKWYILMIYQRIF